MIYGSRPDRDVEIEMTNLLDKIQIYVDNSNKYLLKTHEHLKDVITNLKLYNFDSNNDNMTYNIEYKLAEDTIYKSMTEINKGVDIIEEMFLYTLKFQDPN